MARRPRQQLPKFLEQPELNALLAAAHASSPLDYAIVTVMAYAGLRVAEACALAWADIGEKTLFVRCGKGQKQRYVPIHAKVREALDACHDPVHSRQDWVFPSEKLPGRHLTTRWAQRVVARLCLQVGIEREKAHCHALRHTFGTNCYRKSHDLRAVQQLLGHSNVSTTEIYTHVVTDDLEETVDALD